jgi:hypothetical protein
VPAPAKAFHDDGFAPLACIDGAGDTSGERAGDSATRGIRTVIGGSQQRTGTGTQNGRAGGFLVELALIAGERLTGGKVGLGRRPWACRQGSVCSSHQYWRRPREERAEGQVKSLTCFMSFS